MALAFMTFFSLALSLSYRFYDSNYSLIQKNSPLKQREYDKLMVVTGCGETEE